MGPGITGSSGGVSGTYFDIETTGTVATIVEALPGTSTSIDQLLFSTKVVSDLAQQVVVNSSTNNG
jgi:hypothetical protein